MRIVLPIEHRFDRTPDGSVWTSSVYSYAFWKIYLEVFDAVRVVARLRDVESVPASYTRADGIDVTFEAVPYFLGPLQYLRLFRQVGQVLRQAVAPDDAVILRTPSELANRLEPYLRKVGHPFGVQVVGDPSEVFSPGAVRHVLRGFFRWRFTSKLRRQCSEACAAAYVTQGILQKKYPCPNYMVSLSDVHIPDTVLLTCPRSRDRTQAARTVVTVTSLSQLYKGPDVLIEAVAKGVCEGLNIRLVIVGDGRFRAFLEARAAALGLGEKVQFLGLLPGGERVIAELDQADVFILPSWTEGLPRAMIEAMARALPCIGSTAGGIPELLPPEDLVPPGDVVALAKKIKEVMTDPARLACMSARNLEEAKKFRAPLLRPRRLAFYAHVRVETERWLRTRGEARSSECGYRQAAQHVPMRGQGSSVTRGST